MQIVIDIPDNYIDILSDIKNGSIASQMILKAVKKGTILPKGHGRLGDLDALEEEIVNGIKAGNYEKGYEEFAHIIDMDDCVECILYAETIIEADKESD